MSSMAHKAHQLHVLLPLGSGGSYSSGAVLQLDVQALAAAVRAAQHASAAHILVCLFSGAAASACRVHDGICLCLCRVMEVS
jgi:hypothetical protein